MKFRKASADEARAKRRPHAKEVSGDLVVVKGFKSPPSLDKQNRSARFVMTSESVDRYGDIVVQAGLDVERFLENPQALLFHNSRSWPCGNWSEVTKLLSGRPKRTEGTLNFLPEGIDPDADRAFAHVAAGTLRTVSIGFSPDWDEVEFILDDDEDWTGGFRYNASEMLECSLVPIPAQPDALVKSATGDLTLARDLIEEVLDTYAKTPEGLLIPLDEYRAKHLDLVGQRSSVVITKAPEPSAEEMAEFAAFLAKAEKGDEFHVFYEIVRGVVAIEKGVTLVRGGEPLETFQFADKMSAAHRAAINARLVQLDAEGADDGDCDPEMPDEETGMDEEKAADAAWACKAASGLPIDADAAWDGAAAKKRMLDDAGIGGDSPDHAKAARGFLAVDTANADLRGSYKLPFADIVGGELKALASGVRAAASRLPNTDVPQTVKDEARAVLDAYESKMDAGEKSAQEPVRRSQLTETLVIEVDTEAAEQKLSSLSRLLESVGNQIVKFFGRGAEPAIEEADPTPAASAPVPTEEEMSAAIERAAATRARLAEKGLIEA